MTISIQISDNFNWDKAEPTLHEVESTDQACEIAYAISKALECTTVRLVYLPENYQVIMKDLKCKTLAEYVCRYSGAYIQSNGK